VVIEHCCFILRRMLNMHEADLRPMIANVSLSVVARLRCAKTAERIDVMIWWRLLESLRRHIVLDGGPLRREGIDKKIAHCKI